MQAALTAYISLCVELPVISGKKNILACENHRKCVYVSRKVRPCWCLKVQYFIYCLCVGHGHGQGPGHGHGYWRVWVTWRVMILTRYDINASGYWRVGIMTRHCPSRICRLKQWRCDVNFSRMTTTGGRQIKSYWNYITIDKYIIKVWFVKCSVQPS